MQDEPPQEQRLGVGVKLVTLTFGGNDLGFGKIISTCLKIPQGTCHDSQDRSSPVYAGNITAALDKIDGMGKPNSVLHPGKDHPATLRDVYREVRMLAPKARILVLGYPHVFEDDATMDCGHIDNKDERWANTLSDRLDATIQNNVVAATAGIEYVKGSSGPNSPFAGHGLCSLQPHFNNPDHCFGHVCVPDPFFFHNKEYLFHPNLSGQADYARAVMDQLAEPPPMSAELQFDQEATRICEAATLKNRTIINNLVNSGTTLSNGDVVRGYSQELAIDAEEIVALRGLTVPVGRVRSVTAAVSAQQKADVRFNAETVVISRQPSPSPYRATRAIATARQAFGRSADTANQSWQSAGLPECGSNKNG